MIRFRLRKPQAVATQVSDHPLQVQGVVLQFWVLGLELPRVIERLPIARIAAPRDTLVYALARSRAPNAENNYMYVCSCF